MFAIKPQLLKKLFMSFLHTEVGRWGLSVLSDLTLFAWTST